MCLKLGYAHCRTSELISVSKPVLEYHMCVVLEQKTFY